MAVVQISKIQVRRGLKNSGIGVPQLSSAEFAWAIDTQELYIGNGAVSEGAPYVGNTKILTEHDNILELAGSYQFAAADPSILYSVPRSLQTKIDEIEVSVVDFGAVGDGSTSCNEAFDNALQDLFRNPNSNYRKVLKVPNGEYLFTADLNIPSDTIIRGETKEGAILNLGSNIVNFITADGLSLSSFDSVNRPTNVNISNLTFNIPTGTMVLSGIKDSIFEDVIFKGSYVLGDTVDSLTGRSSTLFWQNDYDAIKTTNIEFRNCKFEYLAMPVKCSQTDTFGTIIRFVGCEFFVNDLGVYLEGTSGQTSEWSFEKCKFREIYNQAFLSTYGRGIYFLDSDFTDCANGVNDAANPIVEIVSFGESFNNRLVNCTSNRHQNANITTSELTTGYAEATNAAFVSMSVRNYTDIYLSDSFRPLSVFSAQTKFIYVDYSLKLSTHTRVGQLTLTVDDDLSTVAISDNYQYSPSLTTSPGGALMTGFEFTANLADNDTDSGIDTVVLSYKNPLASGSTGTISYQISYGV